MFYGVDVNHARLFPLGQTLTDDGGNLLGSLSLDRVAEMLTAVGSGIRCPPSIPLRRAIRITARGRAQRSFHAECICGSRGPTQAHSNSVARC
jgi:hypothetical protein